MEETTIQGIVITIKPVYAGWIAEFTLAGKNFQTRHQSHKTFAFWDAKNLIDSLQRNEGCKHFGMEMP